jgi:hypothetical protein
MNTEKYLNNFFRSARLLLYAHSIESCIESGERSERNYHSRYPQILPDRRTKRKRIDRNVKVEQASHRSKGRREADKCYPPKVLPHLRGDVTTGGRMDG